ncbi:MAG: hypothetical protein FJ279_27565, partial [Planctomycetes bacterium]|nr:hypothetical protein [Planctomycetota bacterium]
MLSPIRLLLALVSLAAPLALDAQEAETPLLSFDDPAPERQWGLNLVEKKGEVKLETVTGPDGGKALRMRAENAGRHALTSPMIPDGPWRGRKHGGLAFWYRGDGTRHMTTLVVATRREDQKGFHTYIVRLFHYDKEWRRIELRHIAHAPGMPDPDFSQLAFLRFENSASYDLTVSAFTLLPANEITKLKPLHVETPLVAEGRPAATIVAPPTPLGLELAKRVQARVKALTRQELPVVTGDKVTPRDLLRQQHAVALGCMADNPFIERLYWEWFTLVDRWYPGPGGRVLQSLHNPYG